MKSKGKKMDKGRDYEAESKHTKIEWVLCSEDWRDIVIMYVPQLNDIAIQDNYANISLEESKMHTLNMANEGSHTRKLNDCIC